MDSLTDCTLDVFPSQSSGLPRVYINGQPQFLTLLSLSADAFVFATTNTEISTCAQDFLLPLSVEEHIAECASSFVGTMLVPVDLHHKIYGSQ